MAYQDRAEEHAENSLQEILKTEDVTLKVYLKGLGPSQLQTLSDMIEIAHENDAKYALFRGDCIDKTD